MKKLLAILTLLAVLFSFAACGESEIPSTDDANKNDTTVEENKDDAVTENEGVTDSKPENSENLASNLADLDTLKAKYEELGYSTTIFADDNLSYLENRGLELKGVINILSVSNSNDDGAFFIYCEDDVSAEAVAKSFDEFLKTSFSNELKTADIEKYTVACSGKNVVFGHEDILKGMPITSLTNTDNFTENEKVTENETDVAIDATDDISAAKAFAAQLKNKGYGTYVVSSQDEISILNQMGVETDGITVIISIEKSDNQDDGAFFIYCEDEASAQKVGESFNVLLKEDSDFAKSNHNVTEYLIEITGRNVFFGHTSIAPDVK